MDAEGNASAASSTKTQTRSKTRQRIIKQPPALKVPNINDDASERKRVLNVLAQRRYRERKRQYKTNVTPCRGQPATRDSRSGSKASTADSANNSPAGADDEASQSPQQEQPCVIPTTDSIQFPGVAPTFDHDAQSPWPANALESTVLDLLTGTEEQYNAFEGTSLSTVYDALTSTISLAHSGSPSTVDPSTLLGLSTSPSASGSSRESSGYSFPDSYLLPMPELTLLRAFLRIAARINCTASVWDLNAVSPFNDPTVTPPAPLPPSWAPTISQSTMPHHPLLDFLPWPSARDRVIAVFNLPEDSRPPGASGPLALVQFAYDMEDSAEGMRIWGGDPCDPTSWEVGQLVFERWWYIFDRQIIDQSNYWRSLRGAASLRLNSP